MQGSGPSVLVGWDPRTDVREAEARTPGGTGRDRIL